MRKPVIESPLLLRQLRTWRDRAVFCNAVGMDTRPPTLKAPVKESIEAQEHRSNADILVDSMLA